VLQPGGRGNFIQKSKEKKRSGKKRVIVEKE